MNDRQASRRLSFNDRADNYRLARPAYPQRVYELLAEVCGRSEGAHVLEIGPGTGQATRRLLAEGGRVVAVEPGADLAAHLLADLDGPRLQVVQSDLRQRSWAGAASIWLWRRRRCTGCA